MDLTTTERAAPRFSALSRLNVDMNNTLQVEMDSYHSSSSCRPLLCGS